MTRTNIEVEWNRITPFLCTEKNVRADVHDIKPALIPKLSCYLILIGEKSIKISKNVIGFVENQI